MAENRRCLHVWILHQAVALYENREGARVPVVEVRTIQKVARLVWLHIFGHLRILEIPLDRVEIVGSSRQLTGGASLELLVHVHAVGQLPEEVVLSQGYHSELVLELDKSELKSGLPWSNSTSSACSAGLERFMVAPADWWWRCSVADA